MTDFARFVAVSTTVDTEEKAVELSERIINENIAACVQFMPIRSVYRWEEKVEKSNEYMLISKTSEEHAERLIDFIKDKHTYDVPEIIVTPITGGNEDYLKWIEGELKSVK